MMSYRAGFAGLIGLPNAGKSTLMNFLVREKVSIVSSKPQTTRRRVLGIHSDDEGQIVFVDSPGVISAQSGLNAFLSKEAEEVVKDSDALVVILAMDTASPDEAQKVVDMAQKSGKPWIGVVTKTDLQEKIHRQMILKDMMETKGAKKIFTLSSTKKYEGQEELRKELLKTLTELLPESPAPLHDVELFTPETVRNLAAEIVREKCFEVLHEEIPFSIAIRHILFDEAHPKCPHLAYEILVAKENHKAIVIGKGGANLKKIGTEARKEIEKLMGEKVFLELKVSFKKDWYRDTKIMKELGYVHDSKD
jgi:GTP-binding protein Era